jgi:uncharacterized protein RhaS with RHS repeats
LSCSHALNRLASALNAGTNCARPQLTAWPNNGATAIRTTRGTTYWKSFTKCRAESLVVTADAHNWIHATGSSDYKYDAAGNMTFNATPPTQNYTYDQENRLIGAAGYTFTYDSDGNRVIKSNGSTGTLYWYMTPGIVGESDLSGNLTDEYVFFDGERVARKSTNGVFYYFSDHLKTASVLTDSAGNIKAESDYYPWGGELQFVANDSIITSSRAKSVILRRNWTTSEQGITRMGWEGSSLRTGLRKQRRFLMRNFPIRSR